MKYLITGLGNIGKEYERTRHNAGFEVLDALARAAGCSFVPQRYGYIAVMKHMGSTLTLLKPSTYMNLSGNAVNYRMQAEKIPVDRLLIIADDMALPFGSIRLRGKGSDGGHNGLKSINAVLGHSNYPRLRVGIGRHFTEGQQVDYVLSQWTDEEYKALLPVFDTAADAVKSFVAAGLERTMTLFNKINTNNQWFL